MNSFQDIFLIFISPTKYIYTIGLNEVQYLYTVYSYSFFIWKSFKAKIFYRCNLWIFIEFLNSYPQATRVLLPTPEYFVQGRYLHRIVFSALVIGLCRITHLVTCTCMQREINFKNFGYAYITSKTEQCRSRTFHREAGKGTNRKYFF